MNIGGCVCSIVTADRTDIPFATSDRTDIPFATSDQNDDVMMNINIDERVNTADVITQTRSDNRRGGRGERLDGVAKVTVNQQLHEVASVIGSKRSIHDDDYDDDDNGDDGR